LSKHVSAPLNRVCLDTRNILCCMWKTNVACTCYRGIFLFVSVLVSVVATLDQRATAVVSIRLSICRSIAPADREMTPSCFHGRWGGDMYLRSNEENGALSLAKHFHFVTSFLFIFMLFSNLSTSVMYSGP
jgi:hypothetical protein